MEIEAKFVLPDESTFRRLVEVKELGGLRLDAAQVKQVHDRYLDTPSGSFLREGYACRVRAVGDIRLVTLKSIVAVTGAYHHREEIEAQLSPAQASGHVDPWPDSQAARFARQVLGGQPLELLFELQQERHVRLATRLGEERPIAEISVDSVRFGDDGSGHVYELEVELLQSGQLSDLDPLTRELMGPWALVPQEVSKFERGLSLCCPQLGAVIAMHKNSQRSLA